MALDPNLPQQSFSAASWSCDPRKGATAMSWAPTMCQALSPVSTRQWPCQVTMLDLPARCLSLQQPFVEGRVPIVGFYRQGNPGSGRGSELPKDSAQEWDATPLLGPAAPEQPLGGSHLFPSSTLRCFDIWGPCWVGKRHPPQD